MWWSIRTLKRIIKSKRRSTIKKINCRLNGWKSFKTWNRYYENGLTSIINEKLNYGLR